MPIQQSPGGKFKVSFYDADDCGPHRYVRHSLAAAERLIALYAGPKSKHDLRQISTATVATWYIDQQRRRGVTKVPLRNQAGYIERYIVSKHGEVIFNEWSVFMFESVADQMRSEGLSEDTRYVRLKLLEQMFADAVTRGFARENPAAIANSALIRSERNYELVYPSLEQVRAIRLAAEPNELALIDVQVEAGATLSELARLERSDLDFRSRKIRLRGTPTSIDGEGLILARVQNMTPQLVASLVRHLTLAPPSKFVFCTADGKPQNIQSLLYFNGLPQSRIGLLRPVDGIEHKKTRNDGTVWKRPRGSFASKAFRHRFAVTRAAQVGVKVLASELGVKVPTIEQQYGDVYRKIRSKNLILSRRHSDA